MSKIVKKIEYVFLPNLLQYIEREVKRDMKSDLQARSHKKLMKGS